MILDVFMAASMSQNLCLVISFLVNFAIISGMPISALNKVINDLFRDI